MTEKILLGFEVGTGKPVEVENTHILVTGLTNKSGKTTTIQALANRSGRKVLVFATKPGELVFEGEHIVPPFYVEKSDWQYVEAILSAVMKEKMRFERAWIIRATKGTKSLRDVDFNCKRYASGSKEGSLENNIFSNLHAYLEIVLPQLERIQFSETFPKLEVGINVMDLTDMREEVQSLVIRACLDHISHDETGIVTVIPELWKFAPEGRGNPVKAMLEFLIRQGATKKNFVWMDSQDLAGVDKSPLKQVYTWLMGLQTERNEVQHTLDQLPLPRKSKPEADAIMTLDVGHFILASPKGVKTVYVMPTWMDEEQAKAVSKGEMEMSFGKDKPGRAGEAKTQSGDGPCVPDDPRPEPKVVWGTNTANDRPPLNIIKMGEPAAPVEEKRETVGAFTLEVTRLESDSLDAKLILLVKRHGSLRQAEMIAKAVEYGWVLSKQSVSDGVGKLLENGLLTGPDTNHRYKFPTEQFTVVEVPIAR